MTGPCSQNKEETGNEMCFNIKLKQKYSLVSCRKAGKFIRELYGVANHMKETLNADFDGDELNQIALPLKELAQLMKGFDPTEMTINRVDGSIRLDISALENCTLAIFSDN